MNRPGAYLALEREMLRLGAAGDDHADALRNGMDNERVNQPGRAASRGPDPR
jgi:hypothetical protein